jgi:hypothetical protein
MRKTNDDACCQLNSVIEHKFCQGICLLDESKIFSTTCHEEIPKTEEFIAV